MTILKKIGLLKKGLDEGSLHNYGTIVGNLKPFFKPKFLLHDRAPGPYYA